MLESCLDVCGKAIDARCNHTAHRVGYGQAFQALTRDPAIAIPEQDAGVDQIAEDLLKEERVSLGALHDPPLQLFREISDTEQIAEELGRVFRAQRCQGDLRQAMRKVPLRMKT